MTSSADRNSAVLAAIVAKSGPAGLSALLPSKGEHYILPADVAERLPRADAPQNQQPHMPLTANWAKTSFALADVLAGSNPSHPSRPVDLRAYSLRLIARYQFVNSITHAHFQMYVVANLHPSLLSKASV